MAVVKTCGLRYIKYPKTRNGHLSNRNQYGEGRHDNGHSDYHNMASPINKIGRKRAENFLRDMFVRGSLAGIEKPMALCAMDAKFTENFDKGSSTWSNVCNRVNKYLCRSQCK